MTERGLTSRREADELIKNGMVIANNNVVALGDRVPSDSVITISEAARKSHARKISIIMNKPYSFISQSTEKLPGQRFAKDLLTYDNVSPKCTYSGVEPKFLKKLAVAGRLDSDSSGLLLFSQDGLICKRIISPGHELEKEYIVRVRELGSQIDMFDTHTRDSLNRDVIPLLCHGLSFGSRPLKPAKVEWINDNQLRFVLQEGRYRQIRRMCEMVGLEVLRLHRVRIGPIGIGGLQPGKYSMK